jgi:hypothetical protein
MATPGDELLSRLTEDPDFRDEFRADPVGAATSRGIELSQEQREALRGIETDGTGEELAERVSKRVAAWSDARLKRAIGPL